MLFYIFCQLKTRELYIDTYTQQNYWKNLRVTWFKKNWLILGAKPKKTERLNEESEYSNENENTIIEKKNSNAIANGDIQQK